MTENRKSFANVLEREQQLLNKKETTIIFTVTNISYKSRLGSMCSLVYNDESSFGLSDLSFRTNVGLDKIHMFLRGKDLRVYEKNVDRNR